MHHTAPIRLACCALGILILFSGCALTGTPGEKAQRLSDYWQCRAEQKRVAEAKRQQAREEQLKAKGKLCGCGEEIRESVESELSLTLGQQLEVEGIEVDFKEMSKLAARQEDFDKEYEEAYRAWKDYEAERRRRHAAQEQAKSQAGDASSYCGCAPKPDCAQPEQAKYEPTPPPKRKAVGMEELPVTIRARYRTAVSPARYADSRIQRDFVPAKQPCELLPCDQCGAVAPCQHSHSAKEPQAPPAEGE